MAADAMWINGKPCSAEPVMRFKWRSIVRSIMYSALLLFSLVSHPVSAMEYRLGSGDIVQITVYDHPELQMETAVDEAGKIGFPLIGNVPVAGETAATAQKRIADALEKGGFLKKPQVNLVVKQYRSKQVSVLGQVNKPGKYPLERASTVSDLLAQAGGITLEGADALTLIQHKNGNSTRINIDTQSLFQDGRADLNHPVGDGDIIFVPRAAVFYIYGEVQKPGAFRLEKNMNVMQALSLGGGITPRGTQRGIQIRRKGPDGQAVRLKADLTDAVLENDVVYVKESLF